jgi:hypothetical protein
LAADNVELLEPESPVAIAGLVEVDVDGSQTARILARAVCIHLARADEETDAEHVDAEAEIGLTELDHWDAIDGEALE